jgi:thiol-disulfide isomerase/thioredoxin
MNTHCHILATLLLASAATYSLGADLLTVGSPAPPLEVERFLKGEPVEELSKGTVYIIEFAGTNCAPCVEAFPHLTELQEEHPDVVFISVYTQGMGDTEAGVRRFLEKHREKMGFRVAMDREGAMWRKLVEASGFHGIPRVYLVGADGNIAWIGGPMELDRPLDDVLAGNTIDLRRERMLLYFDQAESVAGTSSSLRENRLHEAAAAQHDQLLKHNWAEVIRICEQGAMDFPENEFHFLWHKLYALSHNPRTTDQALKFAAELSARMPYSFDRNYGQRGSTGRDANDPNVQIARFLIDEEANDDPLLSDAATILLAKAGEALVRIKDDSTREEKRSYIRWISAMAAAKRHDFATAAALARESLNWSRQKKNPETTDEARSAWEANRQETLKVWQVVLARYERAAAKDARKP